MDHERLFKRQEFIDRVNRWAEANHAPGVTDRMLEDWNEESIFPRAIVRPPEFGQPPLWYFNWRYYYRALVICQLKRDGQKRFSELRVTLWFRGIEIPGGPPRLDMSSEYERCCNSLLRQINTPYIPTCDENEDSKRVATLLRQMGKVSPLLAISFLKSDGNLGYRTTRARTSGGAERISAVITTQNAGLRFAIV